jgi:protein-L-isoaspartate(D-aspartate) O-methyltransferase
MTKSLIMDSFERTSRKYQLVKMVQEIERRFLLDDMVKEALLSVDRAEFVPTIFRHLAYNIDALPIDGEQWISSPLTVAKMTQYLEPAGADSVLEIGCGSGYQAAVLSKLFRRVFTVERIHDLLVDARDRFRRLGIINVHTKFDDGNFGWPEFAPYDRILFSASPTYIPDTIFDQLADGGILVAPLNLGGYQRITRFYKDGNKIVEELLEECNFVPFLKGKVY